jgi:hypoxanthine phosphoribosyltransferase
MYDLSFREIKKRLDCLVLPDFDFIIGIAAGGVIPATLVAYKTGIELKLIKINFRDESNNPQHHEPIILNGLDSDIKDKRLLLIDDVAVTGKTLKTAKSCMLGNYIETLVFKGRADYVLLPEIDNCVNWPWKFKPND